MSMNKDRYGKSITIDVVQGGFIVTYPVPSTDDPTGYGYESAREVFISPRKLNLKLKEIINELSLVPVEK